MKRFVFGSAFLLVAILVALIVVTPLFSNARLHAQSVAPAGQRPSVFALEHQHGKPAAGIVSSTFTFSCASSGAQPGNLLINITEKVIHDADSGQAGNYWAFDAFTRTIKVWNTGPDTYCAVVNYKGTFAAVGGQQSPGTTATSGGTLSGEEVGTFAGGYQASITGQLDVADPGNWPLVGKVNGGNAVDYQCDIQGNCPGVIDWTAKYFNTGLTFNEDPWGWKYVGRDGPTASDAGKSAGVWVNSSTGNSGDILDVD